MWLSYVFRIGRKARRFIIVRQSNAWTSIATILRQAFGVGFKAIPIIARERRARGSPDEDWQDSPATPTTPPPPRMGSWYRAKRKKRPLRKKVTTRKSERRGVLEEPRKASRCFCPLVVAPAIEEGGGALYGLVMGVARPVSRKTPRRETPPRNKCRGSSFITARGGRGAMHTWILRRTMDNGIVERLLEDAYTYSSGPDKNQA